MTTHKSGNGTIALCKRISAVAGTILAVSGTLALIINLYGNQVFANKTEIRDIKNQYVTKEVYSQQVENTNKQLDRLEKLVLLLTHAQGVGTRAEAIIRGEN